MGFTCAVALFGLPSLAWYISINGAFQIKKGPGNVYIVVYVVQYKTAVNQPVISQQDRCVWVDNLPLDLWAMIYTDIKKNMDPFYDTDSQSLEFTDC